MSCAASLGWGNESLFKWSRSHDQDGHHPIYGKTFKNILLWNLNADDLETWSGASSTRLLPSVFKWCPWVDLDLFYGKSNLVPYAFVWEKTKTMDFSENIVVCNTYITVGRCSQLKWVHEALWVLEVKVIHWPWSKSLRFNIYNFFSSITHDFNISSALRWAKQSQWSSGSKFILKYCVLHPLMTINVYFAFNRHSNIYFYWKIKSMCSLFIELFCLTWWLIDIFLQLVE